MEKLISPDRALELVLAHALTPRRRYLPADQAVGLVLAEDIVADRPYPPYPRAMMDGFAVRVADAGATVPIAGMTAAGAEPDFPVRPGHCVEIMTGACCPEGTEAVVPYEDCTRAGESVTLPAHLIPAAHIAPVGSECPSGNTILRAGESFSPLAAAVLATFGYTEIAVHRPPRIGMISTGRELIGAGQEPSPIQIRDSNSPLLRAMALEAGVSDFSARLAPDDLPALRAALIAMEDRDIILLSGGVSAGAWDLVPEALRQWGAETIFHKITQRPGKPLLFARRNRSLVFALPGNPLACHLGFHRYVAPIIRAFMGQPTTPARRSARLASRCVNRGPRTFFQLCRFSEDGGEPSVAPLKGLGSADIFSAAHANSYLRLDAGADFAADTTVSCELLGRYQWPI